MSTTNNPRTFVICDGCVEDCSKTECYKDGGPCHHTSNQKHALNPEDYRIFIESPLHDNWEVSDII